MYNNTYYRGDEFSDDKEDSDEKNKSDMCGW